MLTSIIPSAQIPKSPDDACSLVQYVREAKASNEPVSSSISVDSV